MQEAVVCTILIESRYIADCHVKPLHLERESDTAGQVVVYVCESSYLPASGADVFIQHIQEFVKGNIKTLKLYMRKSDSAKMDKRSLDRLAPFGKGIDGVKGGQDRFSR